MLPLRSRTGRVAQAAWASGMLALALASVLLMVAGCGNDAFAPPPPPDLGDVPSLTAPTVELILAGPASPERELWERAARQETGRLKVILRMSRPQAGDPPSATAERVRGAIGRKASALIVEAPDDPAIAAALNDVRAAGVPVVALGRKVPTRDPARPLASVAFTPYEETAHQVVDALVRDAHDRGLSGGHALIPLNIRSDPGRDQEVALLSRLMRDAGVTDVQTVPFDDDWTKARKALAERILADPAVTLLLSHEDKGFDAAVGAIDDVRSQRELGLAGFKIVDSSVSSATFSRGSAIADRNIPVFIHRAVRLAVGLARGEATEEDVVVDRPLHINTRAAGPAPKPALPVTDPHPTKKG